MPYEAGSAVSSGDRRPLVSPFVCHELHPPLELDPGLGVLIKGGPSTQPHCAPLLCSRPQGDSRGASRVAFGVAVGTPTTGAPQDGIGELGTRCGGAGI